MKKTILAGIFVITMFIGGKFWIDSKSQENSRVELAAYSTDVQNNVDTKNPDIDSDNWNDIPQGSFIYELYFAEFGGRISNSECLITIIGNEITVEQTESTNLKGDKIIFTGLIVKHKSGSWILSKTLNDRNAEEIGGCTDFPIIDFVKKIIEWC
jgi:hypothetical protein